MNQNKELSNGNGMIKGLNSEQSFHLNIEQMQKERERAKMNTIPLCEISLRYPTVVKVFIYLYIYIEKSVICSPDINDYH